MVQQMNPISGKIGKSIPAGLKDVMNDFKDSRIAKFLTLQKLSVPSNINDDVVKQQGNRQGECYQLSCMFVLDNPGWILCHGVIDPPLGPFSGTDYEHAWSEKGNMLYEAVFNQFYKKKDYYEVYVPKVKKRYSSTQARKAVLKHSTWGPW